MTQTQGNKAVRRSWFWTGWILALINSHKSRFYKYTEGITGHYVQKLKGKYDDTGPANRESQKRNRNYKKEANANPRVEKYGSWNGDSNRRFEIEETISELENQSIEIVQSEEQTHKRIMKILRDL